MILAMGVEYRRLGIPSLEDLSGRGVYYGYSPSDAPRFTDGAVFVVGGANSAGQAAVHLGRYAASVTLLSREARSMRCRGTSSTRSSRSVMSTYGARRGSSTERGGLARAPNARGPTGTTTVPADALFILIGAEPRTGWLPDEIARDGHGFVVTGVEEHMLDVGSRCLRDRGRPRRLGQARRVRGRRGFGRDPPGAPVPRDGARSGAHA